MHFKCHPNQVPANDRKIQRSQQNVMIDKVTESPHMRTFEHANISQNDRLKCQLYKFEQKPGTDFGC